MSEINKANLVKVFDKAIKNDDKLIYVLVEAEGIREAILIPKESFEAKREFYKRAYTDNLIHAMNSNVKIGGFGVMDTDIFNDIL